MMVAKINAKVFDKLSFAYNNFKYAISSVYVAKMYVGVQIAPVWFPYKHVY